MEKTISVNMDSLREANLDLPEDVLHEIGNDINEVLMAAMLSDKEMKEMGLKIIMDTHKDFIRTKKEAILVYDRMNDVIRRDCLLSFIKNNLKIFADEKTARDNMSDREYRYFKISDKIHLVY